MGFRSAILRVGFWQNGFFADFDFGPLDFFTDFLAGFFLLIFVGKSAHKNPPGKSPAKSSKIYTNKNPRHISAEGPAQQFALDTSIVTARSKGIPQGRRCLHREGAV